MLDIADTTVDLRRVEYHVVRVIDRIEEVGPPPTIGARLLDGS